MAASGAYVFVYLYRWEWNRALVSGVIFLAAEIALLGALILDRVARLGRRLDESTGAIGAARPSTSACCAGSGTTPRSRRSRSPG